VEERSVDTTLDHLPQTIDERDPHVQPCQEQQEPKKACVSVAEACKKQCTSCRDYIPQDAIVCRQCRSYQGWWWGFAFIWSTAAPLALILSWIFFIAQHLITTKIPPQTQISAIADVVDNGDIALQVSNKSNATFFFKGAYLVCEDASIKMQGGLFHNDGSDPTILLVLQKQTGTSVFSGQTRNEMHLSLDAAEKLIIRNFLQKHPTRRCFLVPQLGFTDGVLEPSLLLNSMATSLLVEKAL
jgi:hypothetical protein